MIFTAAEVRLHVTEGLRAAGAPGATVRSAAGAEYNPVHELVKGFAAVFSQETASAAATSRWMSPPSGTYYLPPGPAGDPASPVFAMLSPETLPLASAEASRLGWTGRGNTVLFRGLFNGLRQAGSRSGRLLTTVDPSIATAPANLPVQLSPTPLNVQRFSERLRQEWDAVEHFAGGDSSRRNPLAAAWARSAQETWSRLRPIITLVGIPTGGTVNPAGYTLTVL